MDKLIKISLLIPVYNVEKYLIQCFESIKRQNMMDCVEVIIVDDGSTDNSGKMCDSFAGEYTNVNVYHQNNMGISNTRNKLLEYAKGEYIAWLDSDDILSDTWFEIIRGLIKYNPDFILFGFVQFKKDIPKVKLTGNFEEISIDDFIYKFSIGTDIQSHLWSKVVKRTLWEKVRFQTGVSYCEDFQVLTELALRAKKIITTDACLYLYRSRDDSITKNKVLREKNSRRYLRLINLRYHFFKKNGYNASRVGVVKAFVDCLYQSDCNKQIFIDLLYKYFVIIMLCHEINYRYKIKAFIVFVKYFISKRIF